MQRIIKLTVCSGIIWVFSVVMILIYPRQYYQTVSTVFAVLFWISLLTTCIFAYLLLIGVQKRKKRQQRSQIPSHEYLQKKPVDAEKTFNETK